MCATGLRHAPTVRCELSQISRSASRTEARTQHPETVANTPERVRIGRFLHAELELVGAARLGDEPLLGAFQRQPLVVEQALDSLDELEIARAVQALARRILFRPEQLEFGLPVAKDVRGDGRDRLDLPDAVVELFCDFRRHAVCVLIRCLSPLLGLNVSTLRAVISIDSPVCGFRPRRDALRRIRKCPNPTIFTSSPFSKQRKMMSKTDSTTDDDCRFERPWLATAFTRSFFVTVRRHLPLETRPGKCAPQAVAGLGPCRSRRGYRLRSTRLRPSLAGSRDERCVAALLELAHRGG